MQVPVQSEKGHIAGVTVIRFSYRESKQVDNYLNILK